MTLKEKVAYIKGLSDGLNLDTNTAEGKILAAMMDLLEDMASDIEDIEESIDYLGDYVEEVDKDLGELEEFCYEDDCDCCDCDNCDCDCDDCDCLACLDEEFEFDDEDEEAEEENE